MFIRSNNYQTTMFKVKTLLFNQQFLFSRSSPDEKSSTKHRIILILLAIGMKPYPFKFFVRKFSFQLLMNNGIHHFGVHGCFYLLLYVNTHTQNIPSYCFSSSMFSFNERQSHQSLPLIVPVILPSYGERASEVLIAQLTKNYKATVVLSDVSDLNCMNRQTKYKRNSSA